LRKERISTVKKYRYALSRQVETLLLWIIRIYSRTFSMTVENEGPWLSHLAGGGKVLLCVWHQQFFPAIGHFKAYASFHPCLMISQSQDGDIVARIASKQGWHPVRGSSSREGGKAMKEVVERLNLSGLAAHIVDGPQGPAGMVKAGAISIARATEAVVVPFYTAADRAWYLNSWDHFLLPKPFARVTLRFGEMMRFPPGEGLFESQRLELEQAMRPGLICPGKEVASAGPSGSCLPHRTTCRENRDAG
jgi:lysophospholipid acyltransferase (LPLAT)-like uncharacterized protein